MPVSFGCEQLARMLDHCRSLPRGPTIARRRRLQAVVMRFSAKSSSPRMEECVIWLLSRSVVMNPLRGELPGIAIQMRAIAQPEDLNLERNTDRCPRRRLP